MIPIQKWFIDIKRRYGYELLDVYIGHIVDKNRVAWGQPVKVIFKDTEIGEIVEPTLSFTNDFLMLEEDGFLKALATAVFNFAPRLRNEFIPPANENEVKVLQQEIADLKNFIDKYIDKTLEMKK